MGGYNFARAKVKGTVQDTWGVQEVSEYYKRLLSVTIESNNRLITSLEELLKDSSRDRRDRQ